jgi:hypothetical protein
MDIKIRIKSLTGNTYTETEVIDGKTVMYVYGENGELLDVLREVESEEGKQDKFP